MRFTVIAAAFILAVPVASMADEASQPAANGLNVTGAINQNVTGNNTTSAAIGNNATADQEVGAIDSGNLNSVNQNVTVNNSTNAAIGNESTSTQRLGTIGK